MFRLAVPAFVAFLIAACGDGQVMLTTVDPEEGSEWDFVDDNDNDDDPELIDEGPEPEPVPEPEPEPEPEPDAGTPVEPPAACVRKTYRLHHLQASTQRTDTVAERQTTIAAAFNSGAHTISWTEIETATQVTSIHNRAGWRTFWPSGSPEVRAKNAVPISWRHDTFTLVRGQSWLASEGLAGVSPSRWVTRVWLRHNASGRISSRMAHHAVSGVDGAGKDPVAWRRAAHAQDIAKFKAVMALDTVPVVGSGDFNTTRLRTLIGAGYWYDVPAEGGSHGSRLIDWIVRRPHPDLTRVSTGFVSLAPSDHRGVRASYDYRPPCQ